MPIIHEKYERFIKGHFYGAVTKLIFSKKIILFSQYVNVISVNVMLVDHSKTKFYRKVSIKFDSSKIMKII
jgi:hypothetical protein